MLEAGPIPGAAEPLPSPSPSPRSIGWGALLVAVVALLSFGYRLAEEPFFVDESAMISQSYFADLLIEGDRDNRAWVELPGYDSSPLPKYLIGLSLRSHGYRRPGPLAARQWFLDTSSRFDPPGSLVVVRRPFAIGGALGCVALYALGVLVRDRKVGLLAAFLLMINPLYRLHARRAMADVLIEAFILSCLALALWVWRRALLGKTGPADMLAAAIAGVAAAMAALAKLNGLLALLIVAAWVPLALALPRFPIRRRLLFAPAAIVVAIVAFATFVAFNPFLTARPKGALPPPLAEIARLGFWSRVRFLIDHRTEMARDQIKIFPHNALTTPVEKLKVAAVQGFGRFGAFGPRTYDRLASTRRFDWRQDWGALIWLPWVGAGLVWTCRHGSRQMAAGLPPTGWAVAVEAVVAALVVTAYLPLAWDRYLLSLQPGSALLAAGVAVAAADRLAGAIGRRISSKGT
jgi:4-amino-4-deoxy-L-arabinose transferase-like glycosyltransferase